MAGEADRDTRIAVRNLWKIFGPHPKAVLSEDWAQEASKMEIQERTGHIIAMKNVSFDVRVGEVFVVMGLSGSGKSTLVRCLIRLVEPTAGAIEIDGEDIVPYDDKRLIKLRREKIGMIFQHYGLLPHRKVLDNVAYGLEVQGVPKEARYAKAREVLQTVGLGGWEEAYPDSLSGGMQQRVGIARALALDPEILLMDEPFSGLDPLIRREMQDELINLQAQFQKTIVFITHDLEEALKLGERIAIMRDGEVVQEGTAEEIVSLPADTYVGEFVRGISRTKVLGAASIMQEPDAVVFTWQGPRVALHAMQINDTDHAIVLDPQRRLKGIITAKQAVDAIGRGVKLLRDLDVSEAGAYPCVSTSTPIDDIVPLAAESDLPIGVVDDNERFVGVVPRATLLASIAESQRVQAEQTVPTP